MRIARAEARDRVLDSIHQLADFLAAHPDVPIPEILHADLTYFPNGDDFARAAEVDRVAGLIGASPRFEGEHYIAEHRIGRASYRVVAIFDEARRRHDALMSYRSNLRP